MKIPKAKKLHRNNTKKYTRCRLNTEEVEKLLEKLKSNEVSMNEVTSLTGVCEKQINNYLRSGVSLEKGHGNVIPNRETTFKIMKLLSQNYKQYEISKKCGIDVSTLSNQCKVLTFIPRCCLVGCTGFGGYNIVFKINHYKFDVIFYLRFRINTYRIVESIMYKEIIESFDLDTEYNTHNNAESDRITDLIMEKASEDYFTYIPIRPTSKLSKKEQIEKYKKFYQRILNDLKYEDIYSSLRDISCESKIKVYHSFDMKLGGSSVDSITFVNLCINPKNRKRQSHIQTYTIIPSHYFINCDILIFLLIVVLSLVYYKFYK